MSLIRQVYSTSMIIEASPVGMIVRDIEHRTILGVRFMLFQTTTAADHLNFLGI
jgi:hypothetical protein